MNHNGRHYFGTDGVRGTVGTEPMTAEFALKLANAAARILAPQGGTVLIGKDTRLSGYLFESALEAGFVSAGVDVLLAGPLPTPGIAYLTELLRCDFGVVISASHNPYRDNGIKFFDSKGEKLPDEIELKIERLINEGFESKDAEHLGKANRIDEMREKYEDFCISTYGDGNLGGMKVVVDCANGAAYKAAPSVFSLLKADVTSICDTPDGRNINEGCGATDPRSLVEAVTRVKANVGVALDGDGDRLIMVDEMGSIISGDHVLYALAIDMKAKGALKGPVVGTVMSNFGLELALKTEGIEFIRAKVGDRYVKELMRENGSNLGGEPSGHILLLDIGRTGDGIISAIQMLSLMKRSNKKLSELVEDVALLPQVMINAPVPNGFSMDSESVKKVVRDAEVELNGSGRVVLRPSGTEPIVRVMVEHREANIAKSLAEKLVASIS